jgi:hypothetical protein
VSANTAGSQKAAAAKVEPSRNLRRFMSLPDKSTTVRTVPSSVPEQSGRRVDPGTRGCDRQIRTR